MTANALLEVKHDGIRSHAKVVLDGRWCSLDAVLEASLQKDKALSSQYVPILADVAPRLYVRIRKEIDGSHDCGCCWFAVEISEGINGDVLTTRTHRFTGREFRGWRPSDTEAREEEIAILKRAAAIGLAQAEYWRGNQRTIADVLSAGIDK